MMAFHPMAIDVTVSSITTAPKNPSWPAETRHGLLLFLLSSIYFSCEKILLEVDNGRIVVWNPK